MIKNKKFGSILLVSGTAIGAGMLALPAHTFQNGFILSSFSFVVCWFFTMVAALLLLEVNLRLAGEKDLISMASLMFGTFGKWLTSLAYLLILYALIAAYLTGGATWLMTLLATYKVAISFSFALLILALFSAGVIAQGVFFVDFINRYLVYGLLISYGVLIFSATPGVEFNQLTFMDGHKLSAAFPLLMTAFGFSVVVPSLTQYLHKDVKALRSAIVIGSLIPLGIYLLWEYVGLGIIPLTGTHSFQTLITQKENGAGIAVLLEHIVKNPWITQSSRWFSIFALLTSFLGVSLALFHFLKDFAKTQKSKLSPLNLLLVTYLPPLTVALLYPTSFSRILAFSGTLIAILLGILPASMAWKSRSLIPPNARLSSYQVFGGKGLLIMVILFFSYVVYVEIISCLPLSLP